MSSRLRNSASTVLTTELWPRFGTACTSTDDGCSAPEIVQLSPLHDAAERGDVRAVRELISRGNVSLDARAGGHRAYRTALHRAAGYGHLAVVKELLKAGANADSHSSAQRTPLHEACTGGSVKVVEELLKFTMDIDSVDCHGQTAAHLAAFNGEEGCLRALLRCGSNMDAEDKLGNTPGHLAASKNHAAILRLLIEENVDLSRTDYQGRTPTHHAAITGGLESLKVLAHNDVDVNCRDSAGWVPALSAGAHNYLDCLQFLVFARLNKLTDKDNSGRGLLHLAAQHGATECLHWLLEYRGMQCCYNNPHVQDDSGATPAHYAAQGGHLQCLSCLIKHGGSRVTETQTTAGEAPLDFAKKSGKPLAYQRAVDGQVPCKFCVAKQEQIEYAMAHEPTQVEKNIVKQESVIFTQPPEDTKQTRSADRHPTKASQSRVPSRGKPGSAGMVIPKRDLATKYFGEHLFTLPAGLTGKTQNVQRK